MTPSPCHPAKLVLLLALALPLLAAGGARATTTAQPTATAAPPTCASFPSQAAAQAYLRANPGAAGALNQSANGPTGIACQLAITDGTYPPGAPIDLVVVPVGSVAATASPTPRQIAAATPSPTPLPTATPAPSPAPTRSPGKPAPSATAAATRTPTALEVATGKVRCDRIAVANRSVSASGCDGVGSFGGFLPEGCSKTVWSASGDRVTISFPVVRIGTRPEVTPPPITGCPVGKSESRGGGKKARPTPTPTP